MKIQPLLITLIAAGLTACGGSNSDNASVDRNKASDFPSRRALYAAPSAPTAAEQQKIDAGKVYASRYVFLENSPPSQQYRLDGHTVFAHTIDGNNAIAHIDARSLPQGFADRSITSDTNGARTRQNVRSYQGFRSGIMVLHNDIDNARFTAPYGYQTPIAALPARGKATYSGTAFDRYERGTVNYHVDFADRSGHGDISGLTRYGTITLHKAAYATHADTLNGKSDYRNEGTASTANGSTLRYSTRLYGDTAEELVGELIGANSAIGFHGTRGDITE